MSKVKLFFETFKDKQIEKQNSYDLIRLKGVVQLKTENGWTKPYPAIIDTGAHTSVIPLSIWKQSKHEKIGKYKMFGISKKEACFLDVDIGKVTWKIVKLFLITKKMTLI